MSVDTSDIKDRIFDFLKAYFSKKVIVSDLALKAIADASEMIHLPKNSCLQQLGVKPIYIYFLIDGIVREHIDQNEGAHLNMTFRYPPDTFGSISSMRNNTDSMYSITAVSDCYVSRMRGDDYFTILQDHPDLFKLILVENEYHYVQLYKRLERLIENDIEACLNGEGELPINVIQKIPGYQLASYFGITPESLSRIKAKMKFKSRENKSA